MGGRWTAFDAPLAKETAEAGESAGKLQAAVVAPPWRDMDEARRDGLGSLSLDDLLKSARAAGLKRPATEPPTLAI